MCDHSVESVRELVEIGTQFSWNLSHRLGAWRWADRFRSAARTSVRRSAAGRIAGRQGALIVRSPYRIVARRSMSGTSLPACVPLLKDSSMKFLPQLFVANARWAEDMRAADPKFFAGLARSAGS
jgi:hypothetical protein